MSSPGKTAPTLPIAFSIIVVALPARAQPPDPETVRRELLEATEAHVDAGRYQLAYDASTAALAIRIDRETLCTTGMIAAQIERFPEAAELLTECINLSTKPPENEEESQKRLAHASTLAMARTRVGTLRVLAPALATITVDHRNIGLAPIDRDIFVTPNKSIEVHADNFNGQGGASVIVPPGQKKTIFVSVRRIEKSPVPVLLKPIAPSPLSTAKTKPSISTEFRISLISTLTAAVATSGFAAASSVDFAIADAHLNAVRSRYNTGCEGNVQPECTLFRDARDWGRDFRNLAVGSGIATGVGLAITIALGKSTPIKTTANGLSVAF